MDFKQKADIRIRHWIHHNADHAQEYERFAHELENAGKRESAQCLREAAELTKGCAKLLERASVLLEQ